MWSSGAANEADRFTGRRLCPYLVERGCRRTVLSRTRAGDLESLEGVAKCCGERASTVLLVTDPFHALRSRLTAEELGLEAYVSPTGTSVVTGGSSFNKHLKEAAGVSFGRIIGFDRLRGLTG